VVQKLVYERVARQFPDLVEHGFSRLQSLVHPGLALVRDFGWEGAQAFLVREWVQGENLSQALPKLHPEEILGIIRQLLQSLDYLYSQNIFHLHLKPENLIVVTGGEEGPRLKITDFGLSELLYRPIPGRKSAVGTPPYTAPDYAVLPRPDIRADLYSVGMLCQWALPRQLPPKLSQWVQSLIQPVAQDRPHDPRQVYQDFLSATASMNLKGANFLPLLFSDPEQIFRRKAALKNYRRIFQLGRRWAVQGPSGMGKSFFARWMQRVFWANGKSVVLYDGRRLAQISGEISMDPEEIIFLLIDHADQATVPAWLEARSYPHVVAFGENLAWAKNNPEWQVIPLEKLDEVTLKEIETKTFGGLSDFAHQSLLHGHGGNPGEMVRQGRALVQQGIIGASGEKWALREDVLRRVRPEGEGGALGHIFSTIDPALRSVLHLLTLVQAPLSVATIAEWSDLDEAKIYPALLAWARQEWIVRRIWWGQEFFQAQIPPLQGIPSGVSEDDIQSWALALEALGWYRQAKALLERAYSPDKLLKNVDLVLTRCRLAGWTGDLQIVFQNITSAFTKGLAPEQQGPAFEILGRALMDAGQAEQAESAYKKAFAQYRAAQDTAGEVQVLMDLGGWYGVSGDNGKAVKFFDQSLSFAEKLPEGSPLLGQVYLEIGRFYERVTDYHRAEENYLKSIEQFFQHRHVHLLARAYQAFAGLCVSRGEYRQAESYGREALAIAGFYEEQTTLGTIYFILSQVEDYKGNPAGVLQRLGEAMFALEQRPQDPLYVEALVRRANFYEKNRRLDLAQREAGKILTLGYDLKNELWKAHGYMIRGKVARRDHKRLEEAFNEFRMAHEILERNDHAQFSWECAFEMGEIERNRGKIPQARSHYESALNRLNHYVNALPKSAQEFFLRDGKREQIEEALKWLR
jgi:tetratricopeptide (TPR) repeat protein